MVLSPVHVDVKDGVCEWEYVEEVDSMEPIA